MIIFCKFYCLTSNHRRRYELEHGEEAADEASKEHRVELVWRAQDTLEDFDLLLQIGVEAALVVLSVVVQEGREQREDEGEGEEINEKADEDHGRHAPGAAPGGGGLVVRVFGVRTWAEGDHD